jgi:DNA-binding winged helix-turn-helix (wHTH) protein
MKYVICDLVIDAGRQSVSQSGVEIDLPKLSYDLLLVLIRAAPNLVSVDALMQQVWPGVVVSPETVSKRVMLLRDALRDDPRTPRYIAGLRGRGYRVIADVSQIKGPTTVPAAGHGGNVSIALASPDSDSPIPTFLPASSLIAANNAEREGAPDHASRAAGGKPLGLNSISGLLLATAGIALSATGIWYIWSQAHASHGDVDVTPNIFAGTWVGKLQTCSPSTNYSGPFTVAISNTNSGMLHLVYYGYGSDGSISLTGSYDLRAMGRKAESTSLAGITYALADQDLIVDYPAICQHGVLRRLDTQARSLKQQISQ